jgi:ribonuclease BN (tRNA processing enzyme)
LRRFLDAGAQRVSGLDRNAISTILFTHFHGDHFAGLPFFSARRALSRSAGAKLLIAGPKGIADKTRADHRCALSRLLGRAQRV